jgi:hypothetical protein
MKKEVAKTNGLFNGFSYPMNGKLLVGPSRVQHPSCPLPPRSKGEDLE